MVRFSKNVNYLLIGFLLALNIVLRYPVTPHELGVDSFFIHSLTNSISKFGYIKWALHPSSLFGLYPFSYPSGSPVIMSILSQLTRVDIEHTILIYGFVMAVLGMFASYVMALKVRKDYLFAFFTSFAFSTSPVFVEYTRWTATTRNLFLALFPLFLWSVFWYNKRECYINKQLLLAGIFMIILATVHRLFFLLILVLASYVLTKTICHVKDFPYYLKYTTNLSKNTRFTTLILLCILAFSLQFSGIGFYKTIWHDYQTGAFVEGNDLLILLLNLCTNYTGHIGILIFFGLLGFLILLRENDKKPNDILIICVLILSSAMLALGLYVSLFLLPFVSILIAFCMCKLLEISKIRMKNWNMINNKLYNSSALLKKFYIISIIICMLTSIGFSCYMIQRHMYEAPAGNTNDNMWMTDDIISVGMFLKDNCNTTFLSNNGLMASRIYAYTGAPFLDTGPHNLYALINGWMEDELEVRFILQNPTKIHLGDIYSLCYQVDDPQINDEIRTIYNNNLQSDETMKILDKYDINLFVVGSDLKGELVGNRIYDNERETIWFIRKR